MRDAGTTLASGSHPGEHTAGNVGAHGSHGRSRRGPGDRHRAGHPARVLGRRGRGHYLQLDDVVVVDRVLPDGQPLRIAGVVSQVRATHEGARLDSDVFLVADGVLPAQVVEAAQVMATRFEPEVYVPPLPGEEVRKATGAERDEALLFSEMRKRLPAGLSRTTSRST